MLIVEDDEVIAQGMARHLQAAGFDPLWVGKGEAGLARLRFERPDVCVLDLMLPGLDGWKLIETARAEGIGTPIVVVSARGTEHDRVHALEIGADDYLVKPFSMKELVARVRAAARRGVRAQEEHRGEPIEIEELVVDPRNVQAFVDGENCELTPTEFRLLYALALEQGRVVTRDELLQRVWGRRASHRDRTVDVFVRRLRDKVDRRAEPAQLHPDPLRRRLQGRGHAEGSRRGLARAAAVLVRIASSPGSAHSPSRHGSFTASMPTAARRPPRIAASPTSLSGGLHPVKRPRSSRGRWRTRTRVLARCDTNRSPTVHHGATQPCREHSDDGVGMARVLIVEDDEVIAQGMARHLQAAGFDPLWVGKGEAGLARLRFERPDVCVLDLMLPGLDGWKLIETARGEGIGTPIVVVSARGTEHDRVHALEIGADDYLVKPFSMKELVARVRAAARRGVRAQEEHRGEPIEIEELVVDPRNVQAFVDGENCELTPTEFRLLYALALEQGRVVTRDELLQRIWGRRQTRRDRTVDVFVRKLRDKVDRRAAAAQLHPDPLRRRLQGRGSHATSRASRNEAGDSRLSRDRGGRASGPVT